jgi:hypothetical protein
LRYKKYGRKGKVDNMMITHNEEKVVRILKEGMASPKQIAEQLGKGYTELKAQSMVLTLARKGLVDKVKAAIILANSPMIKFLNYGSGAELKGGLPVQKLR